MNYLIKHTTFIRPSINDSLSSRCSASPRGKIGKRIWSNASGFYSLVLPQMEPVLQEIQVDEPLFQLFPGMTKQEIVNRALMVRKEAMEKESPHR